MRQLFCSESISNVIVPSPERREKSWERSNLGSVESSSIIAERSSEGNIEAIATTMSLDDCPDTLRTERTVWKRRFMAMSTSSDLSTPEMIWILLRTSAVAGETSHDRLTFPELVMWFS